MTLAEGLELFPLLARYERGLAPLKDAEPGPITIASRLSVGLREDLSVLLTKVAPTMSAEQSDAWLTVMVAALGDLPGRVAREAAQAALHRPMSFPNQIEAEIRTLAAGLMARHRLACERLRQMAAEANRRALVEEEEVAPMTDDEIRRMKPEMRGLGLACGALTQDQIDRALAGFEGESQPEQRAA
ncbi:hypothetical protein [Sphingomonas pituitosa]|uniref:hypothetical protein n=1 Tax=Sphingomonas pituitosa TaxID=99597 RepID=UPI00082D8E00|nr:hypothetical protein [Sphingomonas pituitosa]